jgi:hypothetical protein
VTSITGFSGGFWVVNREHTEGLNLTLWASDKALKATAEHTSTQACIWMIFAPMMCSNRTCTGYIGYPFAETAFE